VTFLRNAAIFSLGKATNLPIKVDKLATQINQIKTSNMRNKSNYLKFHLFVMIFPLKYHVSLKEKKLPPAWT